MTGRRPFSTGRRRASVERLAQRLVRGEVAAGAVLVRPDARVVARWPAAENPRDDLAAAVRSRWFDGDVAAAAASSAQQRS